MAFDPISVRVAVVPLTVSPALAAIPEADNAPTDPLVVPGLTGALAELRVEVSDTNAVLTPTVAPSAASNPVAWAPPGVGALG